MVKNSCAAATGAFTAAQPRGMRWCGMIWHVMVWSGVVWCGVVWHVNL